jgi:hypothetical protein
MNYAFASVYYPAECVACGRELGEQGADPDGFACDDCFIESERKAHEEAVKDFRWAARDWLRCTGCKGTGERRDEYCYCRLGQAAHAAEAKRMAFVKSLPALAVTSPRVLREAELVAK